MEISILLAKIMGPTLILLSISEYRNISIWSDVHPTLVYLNGLIWFIAGLVISVFHPVWVGWVMVITILGWILMALGVFRMLFPRAKQAGKGNFTNIIFTIQFLSGLFLSYKGFFYDLSGN